MQQHIGHLLKIITDRLKVHADADLKRFGLTSTQTRVLIFLNEKGGQATQKEIEDFLEVSHPTVVGVVSRLEENGFVFSYFAPEDKRNKIVRQTEKAAVISEEMDAIFCARDKKMLGSLSESQIAELEKMLLIIYKNLG